MKKLNRRRIERAIDAAITALAITIIIAAVCYAGYIIGTLV